MGTVNLEIFVSFIFAKLKASHKRNIVKIKSSQNGEITLLTTDIGQSNPSREIFRSQVCLLTLFAKIKFMQKFPDLQYPTFQQLKLAYLK